MNCLCCSECSVLCSVIDGGFRGDARLSSLEKSSHSNENDKLLFETNSKNDEPEHVYPSSSLVTVGNGDRHGLKPLALNEVLHCLISSDGNSVQL